jgi:hypothetical protein
MKLFDIAKQVIREDTWGNNPSAAGGMSPGQAPNAKSPAPQPTGGEKLYDVGKDFHNFETTVEREEEAASKNLQNTVKQQLGNKKVVARASKGSVGQTEQDYEIDVVSVDVTYMSDKHYVILKGTDDKDYYINTTFKVKVLGAAEKKKPSSTPAPAAPGNVPVTGKKNVGGIAYPQTMGMGTNPNSR